MNQMTEEEAIGNIGKRENAGKQRFLHFTQILSTLSKKQVNKRLHQFSHIEIVLCKCFKVGQVLNFVV